MISEFLKLDGSSDAVIDGSASAKEFSVAAVGGDYILSHMIVFVRDRGIFSPEKYGALDELAKGLRVEIRDENNIFRQDLLDGLTIKSNADWGRYCGVNVERKAWGVGLGDEILIARWSFYESGKYLELLHGWRLQVIVQDDMTELIEHRFSVQGHR